VQGFTLLVQQDLDFYIDNRPDKNPE